MNGYFAAGRLSENEKNDILAQHKSLYNGYRTMQPQVNNEQPLYVYDPAQDKVGAVMNNKGEVKAYTNVGINESTEQKEVCDECGAMMMEGECSECGWKGEVGDMEEGKLNDLGVKAKNWMNKPFSPDIEDYIGRVLDIIDNPEKKGDKEDDELEFVGGGSPGHGAPPFRKKKDMDEDSSEPSFMDKAWDTAKDVGMFAIQNPEILAALEEDMDEEVCECGGMMKEGECMECGYKMEELDEVGHLDDIYDEQDLDPNAEFDYVKGASNKTNAFHVKEQADDYVDNFEDPDNEDDGFEDMNASEVTDEIEEQGGNAPDFDISNVDSAYNFQSNGPMAGGDVYPVYEDDCDECWEKMESAWAEEVDEQDISGVQGIYGDMEPAFDFDSEGPGKAGPYQHNQYNEGAYVIGSDGDSRDKKPGEKISAFSLDDIKDMFGGEEDDSDEDELDVDFDEFDPRDKSWEEITAHTGDDEFGGVDEDIKESLVIQKNRIMEMMNRMKIIK